MASKRPYNKISGGETEQSEKGPNPAKINGHSSSSSQQEVETLPEGGKKGADAGHGNRFQSKLLILYAMRAINSGYQFYLGTELSSGEKFDDLIFHYKEKNENNYRQQYLQAKHKLNENDSTLIKAKDLLDDGDFGLGLLKYFQSYVKIRSQGNNVEHFIICTNVHFTKNFDKINSSFYKKGIIIDPMAQETWPKLLDCKNVKNEQNCYEFQANGKLKSILTGNFLQCIENCTDEGMKFLFQNCKEIINGKQFRKMENNDHTVDEMKNFFKNKRQLLAEEFLNDFLEKLVFAVKMPNEDELDDILRTEVAKYYNLSNADLQSDFVKNKMVNWFKKQENVWLTSDSAEKFLKNEAGEFIKLSHRTSLSIDYQRQTLKLGVLKFDEDEVVRQLTDILEEFWNSQEKVKRIKSETPKLTAVKIISAIQKMKEFPNEDDYWVISSRKLKENVNELEQSKRAERCHHLFVIVDEDTENPLENDTSYQNSIPLDMKKKIIVISKNVSPGDSADPITFDNFDEDTKIKIRNIPVLFQGRIDTTVRDLIEESQLDSKFIENLLYAENKTNSVPSFNSGFNSSFYIQRTLKFPQEDQLLNKLAEAMEKDRKNNESNSMDTSKKEDNKGEKFNKKERKNLSEEIRIDSNGKIHWLIDDDKRKREIWEKLKILLEQNNSSDLSLLSTVNESELIDGRNKRIIIKGVAGTGKSTILSHYYEKIKEANSDKLVIKISLMNYSKALMNEKSINEFLINNVMGQNAFARSLLKHRLETGDRIILMLDGFDEIGTECQNKVVELVKDLNESIPLYITTRPHLANKLQFQLSQLAYRLERFTKEDQINYLTSIWKEYLIENGEEEKEVITKVINVKKIKTFARQLIKRVSKTLKDKEKEFIGIPLQCRILAESFQSKINEEIIQKPNADLSYLISDEQQFDLAALYKSLIDEKRKVFRQKKIPRKNFGESHIVDTSIEFIINKTERQLIKLAAQVIINKEKDVDILIPPVGFQSKFARKMEERQLNEFGIRFGLVDAKGENGIQFLHRTYAEYLVADYIFNGFLLDEEKHNNLLENESVRKWIMEEMLVEDNYEGVRVFFDSMLKEIFDDKEWKSRIQNNHLPDRLQQFFDSFNLKIEILALEKSFTEMNSNISLLIFDCLDVICHETEIPSVIDCFFRKIPNVFRQRIDVFDRLLKYLDNAVDSDGDCDDCHEVTEGSIWTEKLYVEEQQIENKILERFLIFVDCHIDYNWAFEELTEFFIRTKMDEQTRKKFFKILTCFYSIDNELTGLMKDIIQESLYRYDYRIGEIEKALTILQDLGRIEVAGQLSRFLLFQEFETLRKEKNANVRLSLEKMGMIGLHGAVLKGDLSLIEKEIGCSLENPENCSEEETKSVCQLMMNKEDEDSVPPFYLAAAYGHDDICKKIFRFLDLKKEISDKKGFLHRSLYYAIEYGKVVMIQTILKCFKKILGRNDLVKLLLLVIQYSSDFYSNEILFESITSVFVQDKEIGYQDLNDLVFYDSSTLKILEYVQCDVLQKMIAAAGGFDNWIKRLIDTNLEYAFEVLSSDGFLDKLNQENQISKLIDILITKSTLDVNQPSEQSTSCWSDFVKKYWRMKEFIGAISKCFGEEDLKRLLLYRDDNNILILLEFLMRNGRDDFNEFLSQLPENLRKEIKDLSEEEEPKLIDHFFSTPTFIESLHPIQQINAIEYYLENGNEKQLEKFSQVVKVHQLVIDNYRESTKRKIVGLLKEKLDGQTVIKYNEFIEKYSDEFGR